VRIVERDQYIDDGVVRACYLTQEVPDKPPIHIREINQHSSDEIALVASRMRQTLVEVMGEEKGASFYSMDWLLNRVRWHLSPERVAKVFLVEDSNGEILGHAIARIEHDEDQKPFGFFSTIYIDPKLRGTGAASQVVDKVDGWFKSVNAPKIIYNTAKDHTKLRHLFGKHGYQITEQEGEMVRLTKQL
jgi:GNAT superfamily N-acetyltransferase